MLRTWKLLTPTVLASKDPETGRMRLHGIASSTVRDRHGDTMTENALHKMELQAVGQSLYLNHSWVLPEDLAGTVTKAEVQRAADGVYELHYDADINEVNKRAVEVWQAVDGGAKLGISIEAMIPEHGVTRDKAGGLIFDDIDLMGASFVAHPANTRSWVDYAVKSITGHLPDKLRTMEASRGENFWLAAAAEANREAFEAMADQPEIESIEPEVNLRACPECGGDGPNAIGGCKNEYHSSDWKSVEPLIAEADGIVKEGIEVPADGTLAELIEPEVTVSTTVIQHPDGTTVWVTDDEDADAASDTTKEATSQENSDESPATGLSEIEDDNGLDDEALLGDDVTKAMTALSPTITDTIDGQSTFIRSLLTQNAALQVTVAKAVAEKNAALELAKDTLADTQRLVNRLLDSPMGRRTVVRDATDGMEHLNRIYGDEILKQLTPKR